MDWKSYTSYLEREYDIFSQCHWRPSGSPVIKKPWEYLPGFEPKSDRRSVPDYMYHVAWDMDPLPLSMAEERQILKARRWRPLQGLRVGDYKVAPDRFDLQWIQRIYWTSREIRGVTRLISASPDPSLIGSLRRIRSHIHSLSPGNGKISALQRKLTSDVYYCLRQCNRLADDEESLSETRA